MRITIPLLLALGLAACADEPTEEERAAAVAEVEAHQTPPPEQLEPGAIRYREIEEYDLYGAGCSFAPAGGGVAAVALAKLDDLENAKQAYARAIRLDPEDHLTRLNAAITLCNAGDSESAREMFEAHDQLWGALDEDGKVDAGEEVDEQRRALRDALYGSS